MKCEGLFSIEGFVFKLYQVKSRTCSAIYGLNISSLVLSTACYSLYGSFFGSFICSVIECTVSGSFSNQRMYCRHTLGRRRKLNVHKRSRRCTECPVSKEVVLVQVQNIFACRWMPR